MLTFAKLGRYGRFANGLFQIASTIGIAVKNGYQYSFPYWQNHDHRNFNETEDIDVQKYFVNPLPLCEDPGKYPERFIHWGYHGFDVPDNHSLVGHMQAPRYFMHCIDTVRHYFRMKDEFSPVEGIALHLRGKDYYEGKENYHPQCTKEYYEQAIALLPDLKVSVFTDDMEAAMKILPQDNSKFYFPRRQKGYIADFKFMKAHKHFITANSSYSLMAAILGEHPDKKIICPALWFGDAAGPHMSGRDCYPETAIII